MEELAPRQREILRAIVLEHIDTGEPVGSSSIARREVAVSSATVRAVMADLEELGLLEKPHTSAGRVPTELGYRYYVDALVKLRQPSRPERDLIEQRLPQAGAVDGLLRESSRLLSSLSHYAAVVTSPQAARAAWERIEFVRLNENRVLAVLINPAGMVHNRLLTLDFPMSAGELADAAAWLNELAREGPAETLRERLLAQMRRDRCEYDALVAKAATLGCRIFDDACGKEVLIDGQRSFFEAPEFCDLRRLRELFVALEEKSKLLEVLDRTLGADEVQIFIGADTEFSASTGAAVVAARYATETGVVGSIGVIGPTRMDYGRAIALVDYTARAVSRLLQEDGRS